MAGGGERVAQLQVMWLAVVSCACVPAKFTWFAFFWGQWTEKSNCTSYLVYLLFLQTFQLPCGNSGEGDVTAEAENRKGSLVAKVYFPSLMWWLWLAWGDSLDKAIPCENTWFSLGQGSSISSILHLGGFLLILLRYSNIWGIFSYISTHYSNFPEESCITEPLQPCCFMSSATDKWTGFYLFILGYIMDHLSRDLL